MITAKTPNLNPSMDLKSAFVPAYVSTNMMISALQIMTKFSFLLDINTRGTFLHISHAVIFFDFCLQVFQTQKKNTRDWQDTVIPEIWSLYTDTLETKVLKKKKAVEKSSCNCVEPQKTNKKKMEAAQEYTRTLWKKGIYVRACFHCIM